MGNILSEYVLYNTKIVEILSNDNSYFIGDGVMDKEDYIDFCRQEVVRAESGEYNPDFTDLAIAYKSYVEILENNKDLI